MYFILQKALPLINAGSFRYLRNLTGFKNMQYQKAWRSYTYTNLADLKLTRLIFSKNVNFCTLYLPHLARFSNPWKSKMLANRYSCWYDISNMKRNFEFNRHRMTKMRKSERVTFFPEVKNKTPRNGISEKSRKWRKNQFQNWQSGTILQNFGNDLIEFCELVNKECPTV